ncbi:MAG TPA: hypothetical protein VGV61_12685 [Thermoanaerobaculia bacterium]|jgi:hypothetical protein|nr:hypothetical protein [Thermoanaerobaculia bacterium]
MRRSAILSTAGFALLLAIGLLRHEMWRDELQAWMLARASPSLPALFANLRYEGHPALWHLLLLPLAHLFSRPEVMQVLHWAVATLGAALFLRWAPFALPLRLAFVAGYLPLYEYGVISRNYALALPLLWLCCHLWERRPRPWVALGGALALLANTNPYAWLLAAALLATLLLTTAGNGEQRQAAAQAPLPAAGGLLLALAGLGAALAQMRPPADAFYAGAFVTWWPPRLWRALGTALVGYLPLPDWRTVTPWNSALVFRLPAPLLAALAVVWLATAFVLLGRSRAARLLFLLGAGSLLSFTYFEYIGWARHHGHHFLLFVACCWLAAAEELGGGGWRARARTAALAALLLVHLATAVWFYGADLERPFSDAAATARRLGQPPLAGLPRVGYPDPTLVAVGAYLGEPVESLATGRPVTFVVWHAGGDPHLLPAEVCARLLTRTRAAAGPLAFVAPRSAFPADCPGLLAARVGSAPLPLVPSERLATWRVTAQ